MAWDTWGMSIGQIVDVEIGPEGIKLGQLIKFVNAVETGGEAKTLLESGLVRVNGNPEKRRGAQLSQGDVVTVAGKSWRIV